MLFLATGKFTVAATSIPDGAEEVRVMRDLVGSGEVREAWIYSDRSAVALVLELSSEAEAQTVISSLPFVSERVLAFDIVEIAPLFPGL